MGDTTNDDTHDDDTSGDETLRRRLAQLLDDHLAVIAALVVSLLSAIRLVRVSGGSPTSALAILQASGTSTVATAVLLNIGPVVIAILIGVALVEWIRSLDGRPSVESVGLVVLGALVLAYLVPALASVAVLVAVAIGGWRRRKEAKSDPNKPNDLRSEDLLAPLVLTAALIVLPGPWWPTEVVEWRSGEVDVAYVIGTDTREVVLMGADDGMVRRYARADIVQRRICDDRVWWQFDGPSLIALLDPPRYGRCP